MSENRFDSIDKQLDKIAKAIVAGFDRVDKTLEKKADTATVRTILGSLDEVLKNQKISDDERLVMGHQLERLDKWVHEVANKIGYPLSA